jgi:hypothetical protein
LVIGAGGQEKQVFSNEVIIVARLWFEFVALGTKLFYPTIDWVHLAWKDIHGFPIVFSSEQQELLRLDAVEVQL